MKAINPNFVNFLRSFCKIIFHLPWPWLAWEARLEWVTGPARRGWDNTPSLIFRISIYLCADILVNTPLILWNHNHLLVTFKYIFLFIPWKLMLLLYYLEPITKICPDIEIWEWPHSFRQVTVHGQNIGTHESPAMAASPSTARPPLRTPPVACSLAPTKTYNYKVKVSYNQGILNQLQSILYRKLDVLNFNNGNIT